VSDLQQTTARLAEIAEELGGEGVTDERAEELAREAAELVGEAANDLDRALRESAADRD
jgi:hypothetical protein